MGVIEKLADAEEIPWAVGTRKVQGNWLVVSGSVEEWRGDVLLAIRRKGELVGDLAALDSPPSQQTSSVPICTSWAVRDAAVVREVPVQRLLDQLGKGGVEGAELFDALVKHGRIWRSSAISALIRFAWARLPGVGHNFKPPPYVSSPCETFLLPVLIPVEVVDQLPPFVKASVQGHGSEDSAFGMLILRRFRELRPESATPSVDPAPFTTEATIAVLAKTGAEAQETGLYILWTFTNNARSSFLGRGVFGFPTMYGNLYIKHREDGGWRVVGSMGGDRSMDLAMARRKLRDDDAFELAVPGLLAPLLSSLKVDGAPIAPEVADEVYKEIAAAGKKVGEGPSAFAKDLEGMTGRFSSRLISWKRNFQPAAVAQKYVPWDPSDFSVDALVGTELAMSKVQEVEFLGVEHPPDEMPTFRFFLSGSFKEFTLLSGVAVRIVADHHLAPTPEDPIDYRHEVRRLLEKGDVGLKKLAWGPEVWNKGTGLVTGSGPAPEPEPVKTGPERPASATAPDPLLALQQSAAMDYPGVDATLAALVQKLSANATLVRIPKGEIYARPKDDLPDIHWVLEGRIDTWRGNAWCGPRNPGEFFGCFVRDKPLGLLITATADTWVWKIDRATWDATVRGEAPWGHALRHALWLLATSDVRATMKATRLLESATYQVFPGARAVVMPGPYKADEVTQYNILLRKNAWLKSLLPPRVTWHPDLPFALLVCCHFKGFGPAQKDLLPHLKGGAAYHESGVMIPTKVEGSDEIHLYIPYIFPTSYMAMLAGREIYGYPKSWATVVFDDAADRLLVRRNGTTMLSLKHHALPFARLTNGIARRFGPLVVKLLPHVLKAVHVAAWKRDWDSEASVTSSSQLDDWNPTLLAIDQIASSGFVVSTVTGFEYRRLSESTIPVRIPKGEGNAFEQVDLKTWFGLVMRVKYGVVMTTGDVLVDYLGATTGLSTGARDDIAPEAVSARNRGPDKT